MGKEREMESGLQRPRYRGRGGPHLDSTRVWSWGLGCLGLLGIRAGGREGAAAANERARRLREPGRLCPPGIGHAVGSGGRGLGGPRAWLGQACCWVTGRRVSPGNGGGYRSLAGREGGGARARAGPADPSNSARPPPRRGAVTFTRAGRSDPADTGAPAQPPPGSSPAPGPGRPAAPRGPGRPPLPTAESQDSEPALKS
ncbi:unnamed protein product [Rangifer tarandus platyrhynchus]|uniref:Uncharacterized protein n=2 Tax=Rangifer tarandus platyrhynchus TaxID=3082113 RepID=A0AC59YTY3_RANTA|nr:unnamed protein product [Rangifer tarandus platyrhynchus]